MLDGAPVADLLPDKPMYGKQTNTWEEAGQAKGLGVEAIANAIVGMKKEEKKKKLKQISLKTLMSSHLPERKLFIL